MMTKMKKMNVLIYQVTRFACDNNNNGTIHHRTRCSKHFKACDPFVGTLTIPPPLAYPSEGNMTWFLYYKF